MAGSMSFGRGGVLRAHAQGLCFPGGVARKAIFVKFLSWLACCLVFHETTLACVYHSVSPACVFPEHYLHNSTATPANQSIVTWVNETFLWEPDTTCSLDVNTQLRLPSVTVIRAAVSPVGATPSVDLMYAANRWRVPQGGNLSIIGPVVFQHALLNNAFNSSTFGIPEFFDIPCTPNTSCILMRNVIIEAQLSAVEAYVKWGVVQSNVLKGNISTDGKTFLHVKYQLTRTGVYENVTIRPPACEDEGAAEQHFYHIQSGAELITQLVREQEFDGTDVTLIVQEDIVLHSTDIPKSKLVFRRNVTIQGSKRAPTMFAVDLQNLINVFHLEPNVVVTLTNLELVNLGRGDSVSAASAPGAAVTGSSSLWLFHFQRNKTQLFVRDCKMVVPLNELQFLTYWAVASKAPQSIMAPASAWYKNEVLELEVDLVGDAAIYTSTFRMKDIAFTDTTWTYRSSVFDLLPGDTKLPELDPMKAPPYVVAASSKCEYESGLTSAQSDVGRPYIFVPTVPSFDLCHIKDINLSRTITIFGSIEEKPALGLCRPNVLNLTGSAQILIQYVTLANLTSMGKDSFVIPGIEGSSFNISTMKHHSTTYSSNETRSFGSFLYMALPLWFIRADRSRANAIVLTSVEIQLPQQEYDCLAHAAAGKAYFVLQPNDSMHAVEFSKVSMPDQLTLSAERVSGLGIIGTLINFTRGPYLNGWVAPTCPSPPSPAPAPGNDHQHLEQWQIAVVAVSVTVGGVLIGLAVLMAVIAIRKHRWSKSPEAGSLEEGYNVTEAKASSHVSKHLASSENDERTRSLGYGSHDSEPAVENKSVRPQDVLQEEELPQQTVPAQAGPELQAAGHQSGGQQGSSKRDSMDHLSRLINELTGQIHTQRLHAVQRSIANGGQSGNHNSSADAVQLMELMGQGTYGKVYKAMWRGSIVAVKSVVLPGMVGRENRLRAALMEAALSSSLSHPNVVQTYTYMLHPIHERTNRREAMPSDDGLGSFTMDMPQGMRAGGKGCSARPNLNDPNVQAWEVWMLLEFCDQGSLRAALDKGLFSTDIKKSSSSNVQPGSTGHRHATTNANHTGAALPHMRTTAALLFETDDKSSTGPACHMGAASPTPGSPGAAARAEAGGRDYTGILNTALDVARAMLFLHNEDVVHSDLKASNILLKSGQGSHGMLLSSSSNVVMPGSPISPAGFIAKVSDFGLSTSIEPTATHISGAFQGTLSHMAPEVLLHGRISKASDVYAFGILIWELYTGGHAFKGIPRALLGHEITRARLRPAFPPSCPLEFQLLAARCWETDASIRPTFEQILEDLQRMRSKLDCSTAVPTLTSMVNAQRDQDAWRSPGSASVSGALHFVTPSQDHNSSSGSPHDGPAMSHLHHQQHHRQLQQQLWMDEGSAGFTQASWDPSVDEAALHMQHDCTGGSDLDCDADHPPSPSDFTIQATAEAAEAARAAFALEDASGRRQVHDSGSVLTQSTEGSCQGQFGTVAVSASRPSIQGARPSPPVTLDFGAPRGTDPAPNGWSMSIPFKRPSPPQAASHDPPLAGMRNPAVARGWDAQVAYPQGYDTGVQAPAGLVQLHLQEDMVSRSSGSYVERLFRVEDEDEALQVSARSLLVGLEAGCEHTAQ